MTRAKHPSLEEIRTYLVNANINYARPGERLLSRRIICRVYDRRTGNYQAMGWLVSLRYASKISAYSIQTVIFDNLLLQILPKKFEL